MNPISRAVLRRLGPVFGPIDGAERLYSQPDPEADLLTGSADDLIDEVRRAYAPDWNSHLSLAEAGALLRPELAARFPQLAPEAVDGLARHWTYEVK